MDYEEYKRKALEPIVNYIESVMASYSKEELEARIKEALPKKESEDERIKRGLLRCLDDIEDGWIVLHGISKNDAIAYLEKQKEQNTTEQYSIGKTFIGLIPCWINAPSELQPAHKYHGKNAVIMHESNGGFRCCFIDDEKATTVHLPEDTLFVEGWRKRPTEWNEEDEEMIDYIIHALSNNTCVKEEGPAIYTKEINWLKSLHPQPKQEWSKEEEKDIQEASDYLRDYADNYVQGGNSKLYIQSLADRIESLRFRPHWKPSEEQMKSLAQAVCTFATFEHLKDDSKVLTSLYNDLQKLL